MYLVNAHKQGENFALADEFHITLYWIVKVLNIANLSS